MPRETNSFHLLDIFLCWEARQEVGIRGVTSRYFKSYKVNIPHRNAHNLVRLLMSYSVQIILVSELKICKVSIIINVVFLLQTDWRERFYAVSNTSKVLQERIEEMRTNNKEKDNTISRLKSRLKDLEEAFEKAYKLSDNKNARLKEENKMFQNVSKKM